MVIEPIIDRILIIVVAALVMHHSVFFEEEIRYSIELTIPVQSFHNPVEARFLFEKYQKPVQYKRDSCLDLYVSEILTLSTDFPSGFVQHHVSVTMYETKIQSNRMGIEFNTTRPVAYSMVGRSSLHKIPLSLRNPYGVMDIGFKGLITVPVQFYPTIVEYREFQTFEILPGSRLVQICHPSLEPLYVGF